MNRTTDVAVIGAGLSGLTTAKRLKDLGHSVVVLEASPRVGGRMRNIDIGHGVITEAGGQWIGSLHTRLLQLLDELGLATFETYTAGQTVYLRRGKRTTFAGTIPPMAPLALADFAQAQIRLERMAKKVPAEEPWTAPKAKLWDTITFGRWLDSHCHTAEARDMFDLGFELIFSESLHEISLLKVLHQIGTSGGVEFMMNTQDGAQELRVVGGTQAIADALVQDLGDGVVLNSPVTAIEQDEDGVTIRAAKGDVRCRRVVIAMTPADADGIGFTPPLPPRRAKLQRAWRNGLERKIFAVYDRPFWRDDGLNGSAVTDLPMAHFLVDNSPPDGSIGILVTFLGTTPNAAGAALDHFDARRSALVDDLVTLFGPRARDLDQYLEQSWIDEPWIAGVAGIRTPGVMTSCTDAGVVPIDRLHWAGAESSIEFESYLEGAVRAAERAADEVDRVLGGESLRAQ
ncbi:FAD-dependent oxidoreductase [Aeromicrobium sp. Leaf350]|uniref:flavin monoamine oxidase family protein n=1 Tax=Aeromicrobium sp. Leaf350 TaxID=2876565 RepID=UPI001E2BC617|nr:FAD-dependent oxidoreductase [Aeromicrobium sp. Leaf350]